MGSGQHVVGVGPRTHDEMQAAEQTWGVRARRQQAGPWVPHTAVSARQGPSRSQSRSARGGGPSWLAHCHG